jgi:RHS repeat-associated protein
MPLASTWFDPVIGLDIHFEIVPVVPFPVPFPHPFVGLVFDPIGLLVGLAINNAIGLATGSQSGLRGPVLINSLPATTTATVAINWILLPHFPIPPGIFWSPMVRIPVPPFRPGAPLKLDLPIPPPGDSIIVTGSKTVHFLGMNAARLGDIGLSCSDPLRLPLSFIVAIPKGAPVVVGGPTAIDFMAAIMALLRTKWIADQLHSLVERFAPERLRDLLHFAVCFVTGHPVDVATGRVLTRATDFRLEAPLPIAFERVYASNRCDRDGPLGRGWSHPYDEALWTEPGKVVFKTADGREIEIDVLDRPGRALRPGEEAWSRIHRLTVRCLGGGGWEIEEHGGLLHELRPIAGDGSGRARLVRLSTRDGRAVRCEHDARGRLARLVDAIGRSVTFEHDARGRIVQVSLPHPDEEGWLAHTRYAYSPEGDLVEVVDPIGQSSRYAYEAHLLVQETDRNGLSFYFGYDGRGPGAYCVRTWGDGGLFDHEITYDKQRRVTWVTDSLGATTTYRMNAALCVTEIVDAADRTTRIAYDADLRVASVTGPSGHTQRVRSDARGAPVEITFADRTTLSLSYDERGQVASMVQRGGGATSYLRDDRGLVIERVDPGGARWRIARDDRGLVQAVDVPDGTRREITRDAAGHPVKVAGPGWWIGYAYDRRSRVTGVYWPDGRRIVIAYDALDRVTEIRDAGGGELAGYRYDGEGNRIEQRTARGGVTTCTYVGVRRLASRAKGDFVTRLRYDTEGRLVEVVAADGGAYRWTRDAMGRAVREETFDGRVLVRRFEGARATLVLPSGKTVSVEHDLPQRTSTVRRSDGTATRFTYHPDGALAEVSGASGTVRFRHDAAGRVVGEDDVSVTLDPLGRPIGIEAPGLSVRVARDPLGSPAAVTADPGGFAADFAYDDATRAERRRGLPGGIALETTQDARSLVPSRRALRRGQERVFEQAIAWQNGQPAAIVEESTGRELRFELSGSGAVDVVRSGGEIADARYLDAMGRPHRRLDGSDRRYGPGGRLLEHDGARWEHDADGLPRRKVLPDGRAWAYAFDAAGNLACVTRPDGSEVRFGYDPLGRRRWKTCGGRTTRWDHYGARPVRETTDGEPPVGFVFHPDRWELLGMVRGGEPFAVVTGISGAPERVLDARGRTVWQAEVDLWGRAATSASEVPFPFRFPGQYADEETGLHHNGLRYYDPDTGRYLTPDPAGLMGGMDPYGYVESPLTQSDPLGLADCWTNPMSADDALGEIGPKDLLFGYSDDVHGFMDQLGALGRDAPKVLRWQDIMQWLFNDNPDLLAQIADPATFAGWPDAVMLFEAQQIDDVLADGGRVFFLRNPAANYGEMIVPNVFSAAADVNFGKGWSMIFTAWESFFLNEPSLADKVVNVVLP